VASLGTIYVIALSPSRTSPTHRIKAQGPSRPIRLRSQWCKSAKESWTSPPWVTSQRELQCLRVHSLSMTHMLRFFFDFGANHSFISEKLVGKLGLMGSHTNSAYKIVTPSGQISSSTLIRGVRLGLGSKIFPTHLISISLEGMDVILGMD
jgi:hypothetical protein